MTEIEKLVEECARAILIADGVKYVKRDAEWEADVTRHREMLAKYSDYEDGRSMIIDAFRRARAVIRRTLEWAAGEATKFLVGDPKNGVPLRNPMPHEIAERLRSLASMENTRADT